MGSHKRRTSLAIPEIQTLPSGPVLRTLNRDMVCAVSHKSNILVISYNDYTLHIPCSIACIKFMLEFEFSLSDTPGGSSSFRKEACWNVCMNNYCQRIVIKEACTDQGSMHCFFLPRIYVIYNTLQRRHHLAMNLNVNEFTELALTIYFKFSAYNSSSLDACASTIIILVSRSLTWLEAS